MCDIKLVQNVSYVTCLVNTGIVVLASYYNPGEDCCLLSAMPDLRTDVEIIVADVAVEESLAIMCQRGLVILNCVGPVSVQQEVRGTLRCPPSLWLPARHPLYSPCPFSTGFMANQLSKLVSQMELTTWTSVVSLRWGDPVLCSCSCFVTWLLLSLKQTGWPVSNGSCAHIHSVSGAYAVGVPH